MRLLHRRRKEVLPKSAANRKMDGSNKIENMMFGHGRSSGPIDKDQAGKMTQVIITHIFLWS